MSALLSAMNEVKLLENKLRINTQINMLRGTIISIYFFERNKGTSKQKFLLGPVVILLLVFL